MTENTRTVTKEIKENADERLTRFKRDIINDADIVDEQSDKANEDMRFINVSGGMWEDFLEDDFSDRTKLEFDLVSNYINRFIGQWNQNRVGVEYKPDDSVTSDEDAELLNGIYRADFRQFSGKMSVDNAVDEQATCGYGAFKLAALFEDEEDAENDNQRIEWRPIHNAFNRVYWDRAAQRIDKRDARRCTELIQFTRDSFEEKYPGKVAVSAYTPTNRQLRSHDRSRPQLVFVAKRYQVVTKKETVFVYNNLISDEIEVFSKEDHELIKAELKSNEFKTFVRERTVLKQRVETVVFSGEEILEPIKRIAGKWIPIIPVYGYHSYINGVEWYRGLVRKLKDPARLFNMQVSQLAENSASTGQEIPIFDPEQMEGGISQLWADRNNKPYLLARALRDEEGNIVVPPGPTAYLKPAQLDGSTQALMQIVPAFVQDVTGGVPQDTLDPNMSGKAIQALQKREDLNTQVLNDNIANAIEWSGVVYQSMASEVYTSKRIVNVIGKDGVESQKQLLKLGLDENTGKLIELNNLTGKKFRSYADVGPQYETLKEQTVEDLKGMLEAMVNVPSGEQYLPAIVATLLDNITGVGLGPLKDLNRRIMILQGLIKPETDEERQMLAQVQEQQNQPDPQQQLIEAAAMQAEGEARERESKVLVNAADANKKQAETQEILSKIDVAQRGADDNRAKTLSDIRSQVFKNAQLGTLQ